MIKIASKPAKTEQFDVAPGLDSPDVLFTRAVARGVETLKRIMEVTR